jgi:hypothetical protein
MGEDECDMRGHPSKKIHILSNATTLAPGQPTR